MYGLVKKLRKVIGEINSILQFRASNFKTFGVKSVMQQNLLLTEHQNT